MKTRPLISTVSIFVITLFAVTAFLGFAQKAKSDSPPPKISKLIMPVYSQLIGISYPQGFVPAYEQTKDRDYINELVLKGETLQNWTQMVTITGHKGLSSRSELIPMKFAGNIAGGFKKTCPDSFGALQLNEVRTIDGYDAFAAVVGCGNLSEKEKNYSESAIIVVIKGEKDYYTIQWAEKGKASPGPIKHDANKWMARLHSLMLIRLCPFIEGEKAPYPSCLKRMSKK